MVSPNTIGRSIHRRASDAIAPNRCRFIALSAPTDKWDEQESTWQCNNLSRRKVAASSSPTTNARRGHCADQHQGVIYARLGPAHADL